MRLLPLLFSLLLCTGGRAQSSFEYLSDNLIENGGFENYRHKNVKVAGSLTPDDFIYALPGWNMTMGNPVICTSAYKGEAVDTTHWKCLDGKIDFIAGDVMMELEYVQACWAPWMDEPGCADNISYEFEEPLDIGKVYELSLWIYVQTPDDPGYVKHVGASFYPNPLAHSTNAMLEGTDFRLDTIIYDEWYEVSWLVRPTCNLRFLTLGTFRDQNGPPIRFGTATKNSFFIDEVSLREVADPGAEEDAIIPFCFWQEQDDNANADVPGAVINFASASAELDPVAVTELDSFATRLKENPGSIYYISGHTDAVGSDHIELSKRRIDAALDYLKAKHRIPDLRFFRLPWGDSRSIATNDDEAGRQQNRRVEILQLHGDPAALVYRKLIDAIEAEDRPTAIKRLLIWSNIAREDKLLLARNDPRLSPLLADPGVLRLFNERMAKVYPKLAKPNGFRQLDSLWAQDQAPRVLHKWIENLRLYYPALDDPDSTWYIGPLVSWEMAEAHDRKNLKALEAWIKRHGWPKRTVVGLRAAKAAPLVLLHCGDTTVMERYLPQAEAACRAGEGEWGYYAMLYDRLQTMRGLPQRYGTQYRQNTAGERELYPEEDPEMTKTWRREIGL